MSDYGGAYRCTCVTVFSDHITVTVPQLFGTAVLPVFKFAGSRPSAGDDGWLTFESRRAEYPVWIGAESKAYGGVAGPAGPTGPAGAPGPAGPQGPGGGSFRLVQTTPAAVWTITHNLGYYPSVVTTDSSHRVVVGEVVYVDINTVQVTFSAAVGGEAYAS